MVTLKNLYGIEKWAPAESPTTAIPKRVEFPHNFYYKLYFLSSIPNI